MADILVRPPELRQAAERLRASAQRINSATSGVGQIILASALRSLFSGNRASALLRRYQANRDALASFDDLILGFANDLHRAADVFEKADHEDVVSVSGSWTNVSDGAPDKTDWLTKELFTNLYILQRMSLGPDGSLAGTVSKLLLFYQNVRTEGDWDYKSNLLKDFDGTGIQLCGEVYANDVPGNIMYGFIGASLADEINTATLGLNAEDVLLGFAGYLQANPGATKEDLLALVMNPDRDRLLVYAQVLDDPLDRNAIQVGIELYKQGGPSEENLSSLLETTELRKPQ